MAPCPACGCTTAHPAHALAAALARDDLDAAIDAGLLDAGTSCPHCSRTCSAQIAQARTARLAALAARERHRQRNARLQRRARQRERTPSATEAGTGLSAAASAALARALARAKT